MTFHIKVQSDKAIIVFNEYLGNEKVYIEGNDTILTLGIDNFEIGENIIAYKGQLDLLKIEYLNDMRETNISIKCDVSSYYEMALQFIKNLKIDYPVKSRFFGSCYALYDYTNGCYRMPCWLWSDAPIVSALLGAVKNGDGDACLLANSIGECFLKNQISDEKNEVFGAFVSRYRYYGMSERSFNCLIGPNDTSFTVKWAILPLYEHTKNERYLRSAEKALNWVEEIIRGKDFIPSHYYYEDKVWEDRAFIDTGFCVEGFQKYDEIMGTDKYSDLIEFTMNRFISQFRLPNGYYGQNYIPGTGTDHTLFARGHAWVLEGLLACARETKKSQFFEEAIRLAELIVANQNVDGSWSWGFGNYEPDQWTKNKTGSCEKGTTVISYLLVELFRLTGKTEFLESAKRSLVWCENNMQTAAGEGFGGIMSSSIASGITGLPFLKVATGYANAFYILAKTLLGL